MGDGLQRPEGHDWDWVPSVSRNTILTAIRAYLDQVIGQKSYDDPGRAAESYYKALALIELLETEDCGSAGGYGRRVAMKRHPDPKDKKKFSMKETMEYQSEMPGYRHTLENRYRWLAEQAHPSPMKSRV